jgi:hypothetical protein
MPDEQHQAGYLFLSVSNQFELLIGKDTHFDCICPLVPKVKRLSLVDHIIVECFVNGIFDGFVIARCTRLNTALVFVFVSSVKVEHL